MKYLLVFFLSLIPLTSFGESRTEVILNLGILNGGGSDGDFPLDGDLDSWEIVGKHHSMFIESEQTNTKEYQDFWERLISGKFDTGKYRRFAKDGAEVWLEGSYNPILNQEGRVVKVVKFANDACTGIHQSLLS